MNDGRLQEVGVLFGLKHVRVLVVDFGVRVGIPRLLMQADFELKLPNKWLESLELDKGPTN